MITMYMRKTYGADEVCCDALIQTFKSYNMYYV